MLVDDFMTDFDDERAQALLSLMTLYASQVFITSPSEKLIREKLAGYQVQVIDLTQLMMR